MVIAAGIRSFHTQQETATDNATSVSPSALKSHPLGSSTPEKHAMGTYFCHALGTGLNPSKAENSRIAIFFMLTPDTFTEQSYCSAEIQIPAPPQAPSRALWKLFIQLLSASVSHPKLRSNPHLYLRIKTAVNLGSNDPKNHEEKTWFALDELYKTI